MGRKSVVHLLIEMLPNDEVANRVEIEGDKNALFDSLHAFFHQYPNIRDLMLNAAASSIACEAAHKIQESQGTISDPKPEAPQSRQKGKTVN